jgi:CO/xanthine dehydrogenase Mo-binding subunit
MTTGFTNIGKNIERIGARPKVKGDPLFSADVTLQAPLILKVLRSGRPHAEILGIDSGAARQVPGVAGVFTAADIPGTNLTGIIIKDQPLLAADTVRSAADPVALVAAETEEAAARALAKIEVRYRDLPAVFDPVQAMAADAPKIHAKGNIMTTRTIRRGDAAQAFGRCRSVIERTYRTAMVEHNYLEPDAGAGFVDEDGTLVILASTQNPHYDHKEVVALLGLEDEKVRIIQAATGGGFGSKLDLNVQGFIGLALYHLRRPVRCVYSREECYLATAKRHPLVMRMKTGTDERGRLLALEAEIVCDTGAYASYGPAVANRAPVHATGPYAIENVDIRSTGVYTNNPFCGAMRGFGTPQIAFAHESQIDLHAKELGLDPLELRLANCLRPGAITATGQHLTESVGIRDCLEAIRPHYAAARRDWAMGPAGPFKRRGVGIGAMWYGIGNTGVQNPSTARIEMGLDGGVTLFTGCADIGQGSSTVLCQIAAEVLGIDARVVRLVAADTQTTTNAGATSASRQTYISGNAVKQAAEQLAEILRTEAANKLKVAKPQLRLDGDGVAVSDQPGRRVSFADLARRIQSKGAPLSWQGYFDPETVPLDPASGQGAPYATYAFAAQMALLTVDVLTGEVSVERIVAAHDVGRAIHPENVIGQICGGVAMGLGFALMEEFAPGQTLSMKDYTIPTCADMPEVVPIIVESPEPSGPFGAKGVGEPALIPTAPAVVNALADALGERIYALPANLERVLAASIAAGHFGPGGGRAAKGAG